MIKVEESEIKRVNFKSPGRIWGIGSYGIRLIKDKSWVLVDTPGATHQVGGAAHH